MNTVRHYSINKGVPASGFPVATSDIDEIHTYTLYNYKCEGYDYYGDNVSLSGRGLLSGANNNGNVDPYLRTANYSLLIDSALVGISLKLNNYPTIQVIYDNTSPAYHFEPMEVPQNADKCLVSYNRRQIEINGEQTWVEDIAGWMSTNTWTFVEDKNAAWIGDAPPHTFEIKPSWEDVNGNSVVYQDPNPWELPLSFSIDPSAPWVSQRWLRWE